MDTQPQPTAALTPLDVRFDHAAAQHAAGECERAARRLRELAGQRGAEADRALTGTGGPWREQLVSEVARIQAQSAAIEARLRAFADALRNASTEARADQQRRDAARQELADGRRPTLR